MYTCNRSASASACTHAVIVHRPIFQDGLDLDEGINNT